MGILLCGLNGAGKSTIGRILAERMSWQFIDNEDLYFPKEDASYLFSNPRSKLYIFWRKRSRKTTGLFLQR